MLLLLILYIVSPYPLPLSKDLFNDSVDPYFFVYCI